MKSDFVTDEELLGGKNNFLGKRQYILETNIQQASTAGLYELNGSGYNYEQIFQDKIKNVTKEDIKNIANKYFTEKFVLYALAPHVKINL